MNARATLRALERYRTHAKRLGKRFQELSSEEIFGKVADFLPVEPVAVLDIGAGSGRDAAWFAAQGHRVTAVEPVAEMAEQAARLPDAAGVEWVSDHLPGLAGLRGREETFDLCLLSGVWHHLPEHDRAEAFRTCASYLRPGGRLVMSLRLGGDVDNRTIFAIDEADTVQGAALADLTLVHRVSAPSIQPANIVAGVRWTWLVLERTPGEGT